MAEQCAIVTHIGSWILEMMGQQDAGVMHGMARRLWKERENQETQVILFCLVSLYF